MDETIHNLFANGIEDFSRLAFSLRRDYKINDARLECQNISDEF